MDLADGWPRERIIRIRRTVLGAFTEPGGSESRGRSSLDNPNF